MRREGPSRTAHLVALGRAFANAGLTDVVGFSDPTASAFLNDRGQRSLAKGLRRMATGKPSIPLAMSRAMANMMALRTAAIDDAVRAAVASGVRQLVILGAGYDGRAWRMPELHGMHVFEVDHPATQRDKRERAGRLPQPPSNLTFVSIDFEREPLDEVLERAGHDATSPTCWIWEGVVMYLTRDAMRATLANVARRSAPGSTLIINYHTTNRRFMRLILRLIGEPQISAWTPDEIETELRSAGFVVRSDTGMADWNTAFAAGRADVERGFYMRIVVATRATSP